MIIEIKIPSPGESITEVELASWFVENGSVVSKDQEIGEVESEKATLPLIAEKGGKVELLAEVGDTLAVGAVACKIDTSVQPAEEKESSAESKGEEDGESKEGPVDEKEKDKKEAGDKGRDSNKEEKSDDKNANGGKLEEHEASGDQKSIKTPEKQGEESAKKSTDKASANTENVKTTPVARKMMLEEGFSVEDIISGLRKITSSDVQAVKEAGQATQETSASAGTILSSGTAISGKNFKKPEASRELRRNKMSQLRKKISERLVAVKNETAMLTTFNEADMSAVIAIRKKYQDRFTEKHDVKLGFMSFFTKAVTMALQQFPEVNSYMENDEIITPGYCDIGIAVQTEKGLMVPNIRNTETLELADIEKQILDIAGRARKNRISMDELSGGTFTITNGGIFGSMLSTPILNPPQSAILGMHNILERPVAVDGRVEIRPMMYLALSYDHRVIDGKNSVGFLKAVKEYIENPASMLFGTNDTEQILLGL
ncbi:MAG: 2-oxoglutarate dehydrogenase complex dihydrolipoyllysine-residue succinyltransferase [Bacteroidales bacterium]